MRSTECNDLLIIAKSHLQKNVSDKYWLINEAFLLWYVLLEDITLEYFNETEIQEMLTSNFRIYQQHFANDADYSFILGWMISIAPWYFSMSNDQEYGSRLLMKAYKSDPKNALFKWSIRDQSNLHQRDIENLKIDILSRFHFFFNYGKVIEEYFKDIITT